MGATHRRDLRSGHLIWQRRALLRFPERRLSNDTRCDVLVVGAGISGAMAAEQLTDAGLSVIVLRRRTRFYPGVHRPAAIRDRHGADEARPYDRRTRAERIWRRSPTSLRSRRAVGRRDQFER